jgi:hypothetical protein
LAEESATSDAALKSACVLLSPFGDRLQAVCNK